jgi:predicted 3-demethylubiquinone-9 3-methyltransferase (glyoxalase superfamily)
MTVTFDLDGQQISAHNGGPQYRFNEAVSFMVECADQDEVDYYWNATLGGRRTGAVRVAEGPLRALVADCAEGAAGVPRRP